MRPLLLGLALLATACTGDVCTLSAPRTVTVGETFRIRAYDDCNEGNLLELYTYFCTQRI